MPARQRLKAGQPRRVDIDDRLEVERQFVVEIDLPQRLLDDAEPADLDFVHLREDHRLAAQVRLGVIERVVGAFVQQIRRGPGIGGDGKSDRAADLGDDPANRERRVEHRADPGADREHLLGR